MEFSQVIRKRRTVRDFSDKPVPGEVIDKALAAGLVAPSYNHLKEWYYLLIESPEAREHLIAAEGRTGVITGETTSWISTLEPLAGAMYRDAIPKQNKMLCNAAAVLVMLYKPKTPIGAGKTVADYNCYAAAWCCIENILLSFAEDDVFATTFVPENAPRIKEAFGVPQDLEVAALIPFGYKADNAVILPQKEATVASRLHRDKW